MKNYNCIVPGCSWKTHAEDEAEIVRRVTEHMRSAHRETIIRPDMVERIKAHIAEAEETSS